MKFHLDLMNFLNKNMFHTLCYSTKCGHKGSTQSFIQQNLDIRGPSNMLFNRNLGIRGQRNVLFNRNFGIKGPRNVLFHKIGHKGSM